MTVAVVSGMLANASAAPSQDPAAVGFARGPSILVVSPADGSVETVLRGVDKGRIDRQVLFDEPAWSRDGRRLAVRAYTFPSHGASDVLALDGRRRARVPGGVSSFSGRPDWDPGGRRLVLVGYDRNEGGSLRIWRRGAKRNVTLTRGGLESDPVDDAPAWSPDGSLIAFERSRLGKRPQLYVIAPDGTGLRRLTTTPRSNPSWSPDGRHLVYDDGRRIVVVDSNGKNRRYLTAPTWWCYDPAWSPDGQTIAFVRYPSRTSDQGDLWIMSTDGTSPRLLAEDAEDPAWRIGR